MTNSTASDFPKKKNIKTSVWSVFPLSLYLFCIALTLAYFEVQIEGPNGWASALPTWRITDPAWTWILGGRPVTGYHISLNLLLLLFLHWPVLFSKWEFQKEIRVLQSFVILAFVWDFLWFLINPNFGLSRYNSQNVWWFSRWLLGFPVDYFIGAIVALILGFFPCLTKKKRWRESFAESLLFLGGMIIITAVFTLIFNSFAI